MSQEKCTVLISKMEVFMRYCATKDSPNGKVEVQEESKAPDLVPVDDLQKETDVEMKDEENKIEQVETDKSPADADVEMIDTVQKGDEFKVIKMNPQPYIICKSTDSEFVNLIEERDGVTMTVNQLKCMYMTSQPTGETNLAISEEYLNRTQTGIVNNYGVSAP